MIKMMVVDDNRRHLNQICEILDWGDFGIEIVGSYVNAEELLSNFDALNPKIIISDIMMPSMNGIELAKRIREKNADTNILFLSSSSEFDYAKKAIDLNIFGYILKPIVGEEVETVIKGLIKKIEKEEKEKDEILTLLKKEKEYKLLYKEQLFREMLYNDCDFENNLRENIQYLGLENILNKSIKVFILRITDRDSFENTQINKSYLFSYFVKDIIEKEFNSGLETFSLQLKENEFVILAFADVHNPSEDKKVFIDYAVNLYTLLNEVNKLNLIMGVSLMGTNLGEIPTLLKQANEMLENTFNITSTPILEYDLFANANQENFDNKIDLSSLYVELKQLVMTDNDYLIKAFISNHLDQEIVNPTDSEAFTKSFVICVINVFQILYIEEKKRFNEIFEDGIYIWKKISHFESIKDVSQWLYNIMIALKNDLYPKNGSSNATLVNKIKAIIHEKYAEEISVEKISKMVYFSSRQASYVFKKETGISIFDYIINYRIEVAKKLLLTSKLRIYEIAQSVGYQNLSHFRLLFQKYTGQLPVDYKKNKI